MKAKKLTLKRKIETATSSELLQLRKQIDQIDRQLLNLLYIRFNTTEAIARQKKLLGLPILQKGRWQELMKDRLRIAGDELQLDLRFTRKLFVLIHQEALRIQRKLK